MPMDNQWPGIILSSSNTRLLMICECKFHCIVAHTAHWLNQLEANFC